MLRGQVKSSRLDGGTLYQKQVANSYSSIDAVRAKYQGTDQWLKAPTDPLVTIHNQLMGEQGAGRLSPAEGQARLDALRIAKQMRLAGKTPKEIRLATGWERGVDGLWRYEFTDAQWKDGFFEYRYPDETTYMLTDIVDAPELFEAYHELKTYRVCFGMEESNTLGSHRSDEKLIWLNTNRFTGDSEAVRQLLSTLCAFRFSSAVAVPVSVFPALRTAVRDGTTSLIISILVIRFDVHREFSMCISFLNRIPDLRNG